MQCSNFGFRLNPIGIVIEPWYPEVRRDATESKNKIVVVIFLSRLTNYPFGVGVNRDDSIVHNIDIFYRFKYSFKRYPRFAVAVAGCGAKKRWIILKAGIF